MARKLFFFIFAVLAALLCSAIWGCLPDRDAGPTEQLATLAPGSILQKGHAPVLFSSKPPVIVDRADTVLALNAPAGSAESGPGFVSGSCPRRYPYGTLAAALIGLRGKHGQGLYGIEYLCDTFATGGACGLASSVISKDNRLALTISKDIQLWAEQDLARQMKRLDARTGSLVMMDIETGEILAMASSSVAGSTEPCSVAGERFVNHAISDELDAWLFFPLMEWLRQYEAAHSETVPAPDSQDGPDKTVTARKDDAEGSTSPFIRKGRKKWSWGTVTPGMVLWSPWDRDVMSSFSFDAASVREMWKLGLGQESGLFLSGEKQGSLPTMAPASWEEVPFNSVRATPVQMLRAFSALINSGRVARLSVMQGQAANAKHVEQADTRWLTPDSSEWIRSELALDDGPSLAAIKIKDDPHELRDDESAKLRDGTCAQVISLGFWPEKQPRIAYISVLENTAHDPRIKRGTLGKTIRTAKRAWTLLEQESRPGIMLASSKAAGKKLKTGEKSSVMPDFRGMSLRRAVAAAMQSGLSPRVKGSGVVVRQQPAPGQRLGKSRDCLLVCSSGAGLARR